MPRNHVGLKIDRDVWYSNTPEIFRDFRTQSKNISSQLQNGRNHAVHTKRIAASVAICFQGSPPQKRGKEKVE